MLFYNLISPSLNACTNNFAFGTVELLLTLNLSISLTDIIHSFFVVSSSKLKPFSPNSLVNSALKFVSVNIPLPSVSAAVYASCVLSIICALSVFSFAVVALFKIPLSPT